MVLADRAFSSVEFLAGVRQLGLHALVGMGKHRCLRDDRRLEQLPKPGVQVSLQGWDHPVWVGWYGWKREDGTHLKRYVICTRCLKASTLSGWGKRRWQMEGWFKTAKQRFGLHRFGQGSLRGVCHGLVLSCIAFVLAHWGYLSLESAAPVDWGQAAQTALEAFFPQVALSMAHQELERLRPLAQRLGFDFTSTGARYEIKAGHYATVEGHYGWGARINVIKAGHYG